MDSQDEITITYLPSEEYEERMDDILDLEPTEEQLSLTVTTVKITETPSGRVVEHVSLDVRVKKSVTFFNTVTVFQEKGEFAIINADQKMNHNLDFVRSQMK